MRCFIFIILVVFIWVIFRNRRPIMIVRGGIPVGQTDRAPRLWFCLIMTLLIVGAIIAFVRLLNS